MSGGIASWYTPSSTLIPFPTLITAQALGPGAAGWVAGPTLLSPRCSAAVAAGEGRLWVVGGWDGHRFLDSVESLLPR